MLPLAQQAYLRTRLGILDARRQRADGLLALLELAEEDLFSRFGLQRDALNDKGLQQFEQSLMQTWLNELSALLRPLQGAEREFLVQWARRYEVLNLKALIRGKIGGLSRREISRTLFDLPGYLTLDHEPLLNTDDVMELLRRLQNTPYGYLSRLAMRRFEERQDPFLLDATLDQQFYSNLSDRVERLAQPHRDAMHELVGRVMDRHNLVWMLRYRYNYGLQPAEALYLSISGGFKLGRSRLKAMLSAESLDASLEALPSGLRKRLEGCSSIVAVDDRLAAHLQTKAEAALSHSPSVLASVFAYLLLRYYELKTSHAIVSARFKQLPDALLREALFPLEEAA